MNQLTNTQQKKVAILLAAYNGQKFLFEQLASIAQQSYKNWCLYVIDDGSTDATWNILEEYQQRLGIEKIVITKKANQGCSKTFLTLVCDPTIQADYFAYSDQDDIWDVDKIARAVDILNQQQDNIPQLYCANARLIDENNNIIGALPIKKRPLCFENTLVQSAATGNTMVFNQLTRDILISGGVLALPGNHDWWTAIVVSACGGNIYYDPKPCMSYRQHQTNVLGFNTNFLKRLVRISKRLIDGDFIAINTAHIDALHKIYPFLEPSLQKKLEYFEQARQGNILFRLYYLWKSGVYRQEVSGTMAMYMSSLLGKI